MFGNRCDWPVLVDLATASVIGRRTDGGSLVLHPYDPWQEIEPRWLDGRAVGKETLAYEADVRLVDVCVDVGSIPKVPMSWWLCFASLPQPQPTPPPQLQPQRAPAPAPAPEPELEPEPEPQPPALEVL